MNTQKKSSDSSDQCVGNVEKEIEVIHPHAQEIEDLLQDIQSEGHSRARVFRDWIEMMLAALQLNEEAYQDTISRYVEMTSRDVGSEKHPVKRFSDAMGEVALSAEKAPRDVLGDVYMSFGEQSDELGQHFTPHSVCDLMAESAMRGTDDDGEECEDSTGPLPGLVGKSAADPACGSGRLLLSMARKIDATGTEQYWVYGRDIDGVCAKMTVLNLYFHGINGIVVHGNALTQTAHNAWAVRHETGNSSRIDSVPAEKFNHDVTAE